MRYYINITGVKRHWFSDSRFVVDANGEVGHMSEAGSPDLSVDHAIFEGSEYLLAGNRLLVVKLIFSAANRHADGLLQAGVGTYKFPVRIEIPKHVIRSHVYARVWKDGNEMKRLADWVTR